MSNLKYEMFQGCEKCKLNGACKEYRKKVNITFTKGEKANIWGRFVTVFKSGEKVKGEAIIKNNKVYCATAQSNFYPEYKDFILINHTVIEPIE